MTSIFSQHTFLVGGAVRDLLLGVEQKDKDYVVVGLTVHDMEEMGFKQVGKDFPVFLDKDGVEYALARTERKMGAGYHGFSTSVENVSLEEDLKRRDLTINAMAMTENGTIIDPFGGQQDLADKKIRHVGEAFSEDPVRILRVARFAARYAHMGFSVAEETMEKMRIMVENGECDSLVAERVWAEFVKATQTSTPSVFLRVLHDCGALKKLLPEVDALYGIPQVKEYHPEIDTGVHTEMVLDQACKMAPGNTAVAFAALTHDLGKAQTPPEEWPKHHNHEELGLAPLQDLVKRWKVPNDCSMLAKAVCLYHLHAHRSLESRPGTIYNLIMNIDIRNPQRFDDFVTVCEADKRGRLGLEEGPYPQAELLRKAFRACKTVSGADFADLPVDKIKEKMRTARIRAVQISLAETKRLSPKN